MKLVTSVLVLAAAIGAHAQFRIIVQMQPGASVGLAAAKYKLTILDRTDPAPFALYRVPAGVDVVALENQMRLDTANFVWVEDDDNLVYPENNGASKGSTVAAIASREALYAENANMFRQVGWNQQVTTVNGRGYRVAVIDTGLSPHQPQLWSRVVRTLNVIEPGKPAHDIPFSKDTNSNGVADEAVGHGTMVAGLIYQMSPQAGLIIVRAADSDGIATAWSVTKGLAFAVVHGAELANISLGSVERIPALSDVLDWTELHGLQVVAPIGNNNRRTALFPAEISKVICVAGVDANDVKAPFSNWANDTLLSAPATGIKSYWWNGQMGIWSGTSFAAPIVTGALAESLRKRSRMTPERIRLGVENSGDNIDSKNLRYEDELGTRLNFTKMFWKLYRW